MSQLDAISFFFETNVRWCISADVAIFLKDIQLQSCSSSILLCTSLYSFCHSLQGDVLCHSLLYISIEARNMNIEIVIRCRSSDGWWSWWWAHDLSPTFSLSVFLSWSSTTSVFFPASPFFLFWCTIAITITVSTQIDIITRRKKRKEDGAEEEEEEMKSKKRSLENGGFHPHPHDYKIWLHRTTTQQTIISKEKIVIYRIERICSSFPLTRLDTIRKSQNTRSYFVFFSFWLSFR